LGLVAQRVALDACRAMSTSELAAYKWVIQRCRP
jgi:hypothetical protein